MRTGMFKKLSVVLCALVMLFSVTGVYATWEYSVGEPDSTLGNVQVGVGLPNYEEEGNSHTALIHQLVGSDYGLNNKDSGNTNGNYLLRQIDYRQQGGFLWSSRDTLGSMAITQGDTLDNIFGTEAANLEFLIYFRDRDGNFSTSEYFIFTWDKPLRDANNNQVTTINKTVYPIYRTRVSKNSAGVWEQHESLTGYATTAYYEESRWNANYSKILSIEPDSFVASTLA